MELKLQLRQNRFAALLIRYVKQLMVVNVILLPNNDV